MLFSNTIPKHVCVGLLLTRCQVLCSMRLQCVSKILTPRRMLKKTSLIAKINRWKNNFQNMYDMVKVKVDRFARKTFLKSSWKNNVIDFGAIFVYTNFQTLHYVLILFKSLFKPVSILPSGMHFTIRIRRAERKNVKKPINAFLNMSPPDVFSSKQ